MPTKEATFAARLAGKEEAPDFSDLEKQFAIEETDPMLTWLIVDGLPIVDPSKAPKLVQFVAKLLAKHGKILAETVHMPMTDDNKKSKGYLFVECATPDDATSVATKGDGQKLDNTHRFAITRFGDVEKILKTPEVYEEPKKSEFRDFHLKSWLEDEKCRDQFATLAADQTSVAWSHRDHDPEVIQQRSHWTDSYLQWSPRGSYLATVHAKGIALWGGADWEKVQRFVHPGVKLVDFSPNETYMVTWGPDPLDERGERVRVWDVVSGKLLAGYTPVEGRQFEWPLFRWSNDEKYVARIVQDGIGVYEMPELTLLGGKHIKVDNIRDFCWSPKDNMLAYWIPEEGDSPARVTLLSIPNQAIVRTKNLFNVSQCKFYWQSEGDYLCVSVERYTKTKKTSTSTLEIFYIREKEVPTEVYESLKEQSIVQLAWEPESDRIVILSQENNKTFVNMIRMEKTGIKEVTNMERKGLNSIEWSPRGKFIVMAGLKGLGAVEFWMVSGEQSGGTLQLMGTSEHFQATDLAWDPTGRYVVTSVSWWYHQADNGYMIWDAKGHLLLKESVTQFKQFMWRPRPPTLLSKQQQKKIQKNLKEFSSKFDAEDSRLSGAAAEEGRALRDRIRREWTEWREACRKQYEAEREERARLRGGKSGEPVYSDVEDEEDSDVEELVEEIIEEHTEIVADDEDDD